MTERSTEYHAAVEIEIRACEWGEGPDSWDACPWADEIRYRPTDNDQAEAVQLFGELSDELDVIEFTAWLEGLDQERWRQARAAIDCLRNLAGQYRVDLSALRRCWID